MVGDHSFLAVAVVLLTSFHGVHDDDLVQALSRQSSCRCYCPGTERPKESEAKRTDKQQSDKSSQSRSGRPAAQQLSPHFSPYHLLGSRLYYFLKLLRGLFFGAPAQAGKCCTDILPNHRRVLTLFWVHVDLFLQHVINLEPLQFNFSLD